MEPKLSLHIYLAAAVVLFVLWWVKRKGSKVKCVAARPSKTPNSYLVAPVAADFDWRKEEPLKSYPYKDKPYRLTMGITKLDAQDWLLLEDSYLTELEEKTKILTNTNTKYPADKDLRGSTFFESPEADHAIREFYDVTMTYMCTKYPMYFKKDEKGIHNTITGEHVPLTSANHSRTELQEALARVIQEDFIILLKDPSRGDEKYGDEYFFKAGVFAFAAGFDPKDKFDKALTSVHAPIPGYEEKLKKSMNRFFDRLNPYEMVTRSNFSVQAHDKYYVDNDNKGYHNDYSTEAPTFDETELHYRSERQVLTKLPESGAIVFTIRTYLHPFKLFADQYPEDGRRLAGAIRYLPLDMANYKGAEKWGDSAKLYLDRL